MTPTVLLLVFCSLALSVSGQWSRGVGELLFENVSSDFMYRFRVAVTPKSNIAYGIDAKSSRVALYKTNRTDRGIKNYTWVSDPIPDLAVRQPIMNVDSSTDRVYFLHPENGRIYCYDASSGQSAPVWISSVVCSLPSLRNQYHQAFTANGVRLLARCNDSIVLLGERGELLKTFATRTVRSFVNSSDLAAHIAVFNDFTRMATWSTKVTPQGVVRSTIEIWELNGSVVKPTAPKTKYALSANWAVSGINTDNENWIVVVNSAAPAVRVIPRTKGPYLASTYNFKSLVDPAGELEVSILPSPIIVGGVMYGVVQGRPIPYPWLPDVLKDKFYWWLFALDYTSSKMPVLKWITGRIQTKGHLAPQVPWVTDTSVFITDYQQNGTYGFYRCCGTTYFNVPAQPNSTVNGAYTIFTGTYKISLPWVSRDGMYEVIQYDDWQNDRQPTVYKGVGYIRTFVGLPTMPPPPPRPPSSPRFPQWPPDPPSRPPSPPRPPPNPPSPPRPPPNPPSPPRPPPNPPRAPPQPPSPSPSLPGPSPSPSPSFPGPPPSPSPSLPGPPPNPSPSLPGPHVDPPPSPSGPPADPPPSPPHPPMVPQPPPSESP